MKKLLLLFCFAFMFEQTYAQNWQRVGTDLPFHFANANNEAIEFGGNMYVVGYTYNGIDTYTPGVYKLTAGVWSEVGSGFSTTPTAAQFNISAVAEFGGALFIGGNFAMDNGTDPEFYDLARWDDVNSRWVAAGDGTGDGEVNELTVYDNKLYAGGNFDDLGAAGTNNIAVYDGVSWGAVGTGISVAENGVDDPDQVKVMTIYDTKLYIGGKFSTAGGELVQNLAYWDGTNWGYFNGNGVDGYGGVGGFNSGQVQVMAMQVFDSELYIGGTFSKYYNLSFIGTSNTVPNHLAVWDGSFFSAPTKATPANVRLNAMKVFNNRIYIGNTNDSNIYSWDGSIFDWELAPDRDPLRQRVENFYSNGTDIYYVQDYGVYQLMDPLASFFASSTTTCPDSEITFTDTSTGSSTITGWNWTFEGGTPATSTDQNPSVSFTAGGPYDVSLEVTSTDGTNTSVNGDYITIENLVSVDLDPGSETVCASENAIFTVTGTGTGGVTYQWQMNDGSGYVDLVDVANEISGATISQLTLITPSVDLDGANVKCVLTNACGGTITTVEALLTVTAAPIITEESFSQAVCEDGGDVNFTILSTGTAAYQWQYYIGSNNYTDLSDAGAYSGTTTATLSVANANNTTILNELFDTDFSDGKTSALYRCVLTANGCTTNTGLYTLTIYESPSVTEDPVDVTKCDSGNGVAAAFHVTSSLVVGGFPYQWQVDDGAGFVNINDDAIYSGTDTKDLILTGATSALNGYQYRCEIGACASPIYSIGALLTIYDKPVFVQGPVTTSICEDGDATFTVETTGSNLIYQWQELVWNTSTYIDIVNNATYSALGNTLDIIGAPAAMNNYKYRCIVSSATSCEITVGSASLKVYSQPTLTLRTNNVTSVCEGGATTFRVNASSSTTSAISAGVYKYQWQSDNGIGVFTNISDDANYTDTNTSALIIDSPPLSFSGMKYRCIFSGCVTENASAEETLTVLQLPLVTTSPQSQTVCHGESVTFTALATGSDITYTWWIDTGDGVYQQVKAASSSPDYTFTGNVAFNGYKYKCIATAGNCTTTSESFEATLTVQETQLTAVSSPQSLQICAGETVKFGVEVSNLDGLTFQWSDGNRELSDDAIYSGVTNDTLTITAPSTANNNYSVAITGACGNTSAGFSLLVFGLETPEIETQLGDPNNPQLFVSTNFQLGVDNFEWFLNGSSYQNSGANPIITIDQAGSYMVVPTRNNCNHPESESVVIIITGFEKNLSADRINFYPNPVSNKITLEMGNDFDLAKGAKFVITDVSGKEVYNRNYNSLHNRKTEIDMSGYESGIYLIRIINGDKMTQYKIRKQ